jgi:hypothetical protein
LLDINLRLEAIRVTEALLKGTGTLLEVTLHSSFLNVFKSLFPIVVIICVFGDILISFLLLTSILLLNVLNHWVNFIEISLRWLQNCALKHITVIYDALIHIVLHLWTVHIFILLSHMLLKVITDLFKLLFEPIRIKFFRNIMPLIECGGCHDYLFFHVWCMSARHITATNRVSISDLTARWPRIISILIRQLTWSFGLIHCVL